MRRKLIKEKTLVVTYDSDIVDVKYGDLPKDLQSDDVIDMVRDEIDNKTYVYVTKQRLESDEEYNKRCLEMEKNKLLMLKTKYEQFLNLKEELIKNGYEL